jgi:hypothetical protein
LREDMEASMRGFILPTMAGHFWWNQRRHG